MNRETGLHVEVRNASKTYGDHQFNALVDVSLTIERGMFVALMGPSGCGKSTLLNLIAGIDKPTAGHVVVDSVDLSAQTDEQLTRLRAEKIGFVFQFFNLLSTLTVEENVSLPLDLTLSGRKPKEARRQLTRELLDRVGIAHKERAYPSQLSGGEMQRVAIARALIHSPEILLADEPTGNLDSENGKIVLELLRQINDDLNTTIIMATHSAEAAACAQSVITMKDGAIAGSLINGR